MQSREFCDNVARLIGNTNRAEVDRILKGVIACSKELLAEGDEIRLADFGRLVVVRARGKFRVRFKPYVNYVEEFDKTFVENRDVVDSAR